MNIYDYKVEMTNGEILNLTDYKGNVVARFEPTTDMKELEKCVEALI